jgi:acyl-CoA synthetase (AMP-forming)/AMP-acid ligase II
MNVGSLLPRHARYRGDHTALVVGDLRLSFRELNRYVNRLANAMLAAGMKKGDKLTTVLPNCLELMAAIWAAGKTGIVIVPASPLLKEAGLRTLIGDSDSTMVIADGASAATFDHIRGDLSNVADNRIVVVGGSDDRRGFVSYESLIANAAEDEPPDAGLCGDDVFNIMYSSGTTGLPKGIVHTHDVRAAYCGLFSSTFRISPESIVLHAGSIVFNGAWVDLMPWMFNGATYILHEAFNAERVIETIDRERVTHIIMVPSQIIGVLSSPSYDPVRLRTLEMLHSVGAPLLLEHKRRINDDLPGRFYELYGLTEGLVTILDKHDAVRKAASVGCPPAFTEIKILREDGSECEPREVGEICGRTPIMMPGYYKRPDLTAQTIRDGWLHSGDAGYLDEDGYLFLVDRIKDMIISGGINVYPKDIEEVIIQHPAVREVAVFGVFDARWGESPVAAVVRATGFSIQAEELVDWTNERVGAKFQRIRDVVFYDEFPRNIAGKTLKRTMRDQYGAR